MNPTQQIKSKVLSLGFTKVGIARAETLEAEAKHLEEWLSRGYSASMEWMSRNIEKRADPRNIVSGAKSVICVAENYYTPTQHSTDPAVGKISRYAWGDDYHDILIDRLKQLWSWMQTEFPGVGGRYYVDTGPAMDKVWAQRAGIGWIAKHTNVITQDHGSWVFLGELITTLELEPDTPATDHCGTCTLCIEACPTGAIVEPYVVDSNRCISYLTIEHHGEISGDVTQQFENWVYGCDICQDVCPWNHKFATATDEPGFEPRAWNVSPRLDEWKGMTQEEFTTKFKGSPIKRTKREGLTRNVRIVLKNSCGTLEGM
ncbi:MAG: tRNA epoxyqueuosine(34) reductase QueG [Bacteroidota bacterium]